MGHSGTEVGGCCCWGGVRHILLWTEEGALVMLSGHLVHSLDRDKKKKEKKENSPAPCCIGGGVMVGLSDDNLNTTQALEYTKDKYNVKIMK
jgi:hypothetical protein